MDTREVAERVVACLSDGYDDKELEQQAIDDLEMELWLKGDKIKTVILRLCERIEDLGGC